MRFSQSVGLSLVCSLILPAGLARAGDEKFPLSDAIPQGVYIMVAARHNPEREFLDKAWGAVFDELGKSGVGEDLWKLVTKGGADSRKADDEDDDEDDNNDAPKVDDKLKEAAEKFRRLSKDIDWADLGKKEFAMAGRMRSPMPDFVFMFRGTKDGTSKNYKAFHALLTEVSERAGDKLKLKNDKSDGVERSTLSIEGAPFEASLCRRGDVLIIAVGHDLLAETLDLLAGKSEAKGLNSTARYKDAFKKLPEAEDEIVFFDMAAMMKGLDKMFADISKMTDDDEQGRKIMKLIRTIMDDFCVMDYSASTSRTEGMRVFTDEWIGIMPDAKSKPTYSIFVPEGQIEKFDKYIPKEAVGFSVSAGLQLTPLYKYVADVVREKVPNGEKAWEQFEEIQQQIGFNLEKDLLSWLGSDTVSIELPAAGPLGGDFVMMVGVKDGEKAASKIRGAISKLGKSLPVGDSPSVTTSPTKVAGTEGFYIIEIHHPMVAMMGASLQPVWGVHDGFLFMSSSKAAIAKCLKTAAGEHDSIVKSERFRKEALLPTSKDGKLVGVNFTDTTKVAEGLQMALGQVGMIGMFANMNPAAKEAGEVFSVMAGMAQKLMPVAAKLNFFQSDASFTTFAGNGWHTRTVNNYRKPPAGSSDDDEDWDDNWGDGDKKSGADKKPAKAAKKKDDSAKDDDDDDD